MKRNWFVAALIIVGGGILGYLVSRVMCVVGIHRWCWSDECIWSDKHWLEHIHQKYLRSMYRERDEEIRKRTEHIRGKDLRG